MVFYNLSYYFWGQCCFWTETTLFCNNVCFFILLHCPQLFPPCPTTAPAICVGAGKNLWVRRIFARNVFVQLCQRIFSHKDYEDLFWYDLQRKKGLHVFFCKRWVPFLKSKNVGRHFCPDTQGFCSNFARIFRIFARIFDKWKLLGVRLHLLQPHLLHHWSLIADLSAIRDNF